ncbi:hypothetical protein YC2023_058503 [Brassica napus]
MVQNDATLGAPGGEPTPTPEAAPPVTTDFMSSIMARLAHQDEVQKTTNDQLAALVAPLTAPDGQTSRPQQIRRRLFNTNPTATGGEHISDDSKPNETLLANHPPVGSDLATIRELAELKLSFQQMSEKIHQVTSAAPQIESVLAATSRTPFTSALTSVQLGKIEKLRLPEYKPGGDPVEHMTAFNIAMARARLPDEERDAGYCQLFVETLHEQALTWFSQLQENSIRSFRDLSAAFLKTYIMFTKRSATGSSLWNLNQTKDQSLRDYMEKFKAVVSRIEIPDGIAIDALRNTLWVRSKFREDLYQNPTTSLQDAIAPSDNFIRMEEDTNAILSKMNTPKAPAAKNANTRQEPRQHAPTDKNGRKDGYMYVVNENNIPVSTLLVRGEGWNKWVRELDSPYKPVDTVCTTQPTAGAGSAAGPSRTVDLTKHCKYHDVKGHDTTECKSLYAHYLSSLASGEFKFEPLKAKPKNGKSWSKNKERRAQRKATGKGRQNDAERRDDEEETPKDNGERDSSADEEHSANRRRIEVILSQQSLSSDDDNDDAPVLGDLRDVLKRKFESENDSSPKHKDLRTMLDTRKSRRISTSDANNNKGPITDLRDKLNAGACDLRIQLNRSKLTDLRRQLERAKDHFQPPAHDTNISTDLRTLLDSKRVQTGQSLNVIMGGSPPSGDTVRSVKDYRRQVATSQKWPTKPTSHPPITFSPDDAEGVHAPHNDHLLVVLGIGEYDVTKILIDTGSSVDLIFRGTLQKMGVDLDDIKASSMTLTRFNGSSETILGTIRLPVRVCGVTRTVKFAVVSTKAPYHAILGTPWLHSMQAVPSTYHQCVKYPGTDGRIKTLQGDQKAARDLLVATVKLQRSSLPVNYVSPPTSKFCSQESEVLELPIDDADQSRTVRVGAYLSKEMQQSILNFLRKNVSTFAWSMADMKGIDPTITTHELNVDPTFKPIRQKRRKLGPDRSKAVNEEVDKLLGAGSIAEVRYPEWLANPVVVKKKNGKWRVCVDFTDLNKACPKDSYPLPNIDRLVESTAGNEMLTFMDAFSGYNQIMMHPDDCEKTAFITDRGTYCYKVMPFGLKNAGATYQRLVNKMFADKLGITMEVYIDDMLVKSLHSTDHLRHLQECFETLNKYGMKLNPAKCTFGVSSGEFLGYIVTQRGIKVNPKQISAVLNLPCQKNSREVQRLTGRIASLNRFISRSTDKCLPFYDLLRGNKKFIWDEKCDDAFTQLKQYLTTPPVLAKPDVGDVISLYVAVSQAAVSSVLIKEDRGEQKPIFYTSRRMTGPETRYPTLEKMGLAVVEAARKLRPYFQSHSVEVLTDQPL